MLIRSFNVLAIILIKKCVLLVIYRFYCNVHSPPASCLGYRKLLGKGTFSKHSVQEQNFTKSDFYSYYYLCFRQGSCKRTLAQSAAAVEGHEDRKHREAVRPHESTAGLPARLTLFPRALYVAPAFTESGSATRSIALKTRLRDTWSAGQGAVNAWLSTPSPITAEVTGKVGFDSVTIDLQHGLNDYQAAMFMLQALVASDSTPMARPPWLEPGIIMKLLDAGALGIICPMINTRADAERLVHYANYAPVGTRSFGPIRAALIYGADYASKANDAVITLAMVETTESLGNVEEIVKTPGLTGVYIGPSDLALSMGHAPKLDPDEPAVVDAIKRILDACKDAGIRCGIHCLAPSYANRMLGMGFDLVTLGSDIRLYSTACERALAEARG